MTDGAGAGAATGPTGALFALEAVSLEVDGRAILSEVTLQVPDGGITVVQGPSGSGKTTLLRLLNRLEVPTAGRVLFRDRPLDDLDPLDLRRRVGMVFQRPVPFPGSVRENLLVADPAATEDELESALEAAGLDRSFLDRAADDLSGGETQRMCLARTLVTQPEALLMDEPTSSLDPDARLRLEATARALAEGEHPVVWVTHDVDQAERLADARIALAGGRLAAAGSGGGAPGGAAPGGGDDG